MGRRDTQEGTVPVKSLHVLKQISVILGSNLTVIHTITIYVITRIAKKREKMHSLTQKQAQASTHQHKNRWSYWRREGIHDIDLWCLGKRGAFDCRDFNLGVGWGVK
jgi:hypothetical protein